MSSALFSAEPGHLHAPFYSQCQQQPHVPVYRSVIKEKTKPSFARVNVDPYHVICLLRSFIILDCHVCKNELQLSYHFKYMMCLFNGQQTCLISPSIKNILLQRSIVFFSSSHSQCTPFFFLFCFFFFTASELFQQLCSPCSGKKKQALLKTEQNSRGDLMVFVF